MSVCDILCARRRMCFEQAWHRMLRPRVFLWSLPAGGTIDKSWGWANYPGFSPPSPIAEPCVGCRSTTVRPDVRVISTRRTAMRRMPCRGMDDEEARLRSPRRARLDLVIIVERWRMCCKAARVQAKPCALESRRETRVSHVRSMICCPEAATTACRRPEHVTVQSA